MFINSSFWSIWQTGGRTRKQQRIHTLKTRVGATVAKIFVFLVPANEYFFFWAQFQQRLEMAKRISIQIRNETNLFLEFPIRPLDDDDVYDGII